MLFICSIYLATTLHLIHDQIFRYFVKGWLQEYLLYSLWHKLQLKKGIRGMPPPNPHLNYCDFILPFLLILISHLSSH